MSSCLCIVQMLSLTQMSYLSIKSQSNQGKMLDYIICSYVIVFLNIYLIRIATAQAL